MAKMQTKEYTNDGKAILGKALARYGRTAPRKIALVADLIRRKPVLEALEILQFTQRPSAVPFITRALKAAIASANQKSGREDYSDSLVIGEIIVNTAPMLKRTRAASVGRATRIRKRQTHLFVALTEN